MASIAKNLYVFCEGETEETFVSNVLAPYLQSYNIYYVKPINVGGVSGYKSVIRRIKKLCQQHPNEKVTSLIDYYGLKDIPQTPYVGLDKYDLVLSIEKKMLEDVGEINFVPYLSLHEFKSLLFSSPKEIAKQFEDVINLEKNLEQILHEHGNNPEFINNSVETSPSKRIKNLIPSYRKIVNGNIIAKNITIDVIKKKCKHFSDWVDKIIKACQQ